MSGIEFPKLLGGPGNGESIPPEWQAFSIGEWLRPGMERPHIYQKREIRRGDHVDIIWVDASINDAAIAQIVWWHVQTHVREVVDNQKALIEHAGSAAEKHTATVMAIGYAALFAFWTANTQSFTKATLFCSALTMVASVSIFVGWELYSGFIRTRSLQRLADSIEDETTFIRKILGYKSSVALAQKFRIKAWALCFGASALLGLVTAVILTSAFLHGLWLIYTSA